MASAKKNFEMEDFEPGELDALLAEGERDIANDDVIEADEAFEKLRRISDQRWRALQEEA